MVTGVVRTRRVKPIYACGDRFTEDPEECRGVKPVLLLEPGRRLRLSKLMSALLRHIPWEAGLVLDEEGWVGIDELVKAIREKWRNREAYRWVTREMVIAVALLDPKGRFEIRGDRIRASYGHSLGVKLGLKPLPPGSIPSKLYHGTVEDRLASIMAEGLKPMKRIAVHLTTRLEDAVETGARHGRRVVVLRVDPKCLSEKGVPVYRAGKTVYLAPYVPPECLRVEAFYEHAY